MFTGFEIREEGKLAEKFVEMALHHWAEKVAELLGHDKPELDIIKMKATQDRGTWHIRGRFTWNGQGRDENSRQVDGRRLRVEYDFKDIHVEKQAGILNHVFTSSAQIILPNFNDPKGNPGNILARTEIKRDRLGAPWEVTQFFPRSNCWSSRLGQYLHGQGPNSKPWGD